MQFMSKRAPIDYDDLRGPYNLVRAVGASVFAIAVVGWALAYDDTTPMAMLIPAVAVGVDAAYRRTQAASLPLPGLLVDATAIGVALLLHGPNPGMHAVAILTMLTTAGLLLPTARALVVIAYMITLSVGVSVVHSLGLPVAAVIGTEAEHVLFDTVVVGVFIAATAWVLFLAVRVIRSVQDRQEEALAVERRALELKNEFVSMVSHELRTPLTGIAGFTETLSAEWSDLPAAEVTEFLEIMTSETIHLANLVEDILVIPRLEAGQLRLDPEPVELVAEAHSVAAMIFPDGTADIAIPSNVTVWCDRTRLHQVMRNLLENAKKYGGDQVLVTGEMSSPGIYTVSVSDNGSGVAPQDRDRIFEHFEQLSTGDARAQQGVGLGLPIARKLASAMGGDLWYEDRFPVGSNFRFSIPLAPSDDRAESPRIEAERVATALADRT